MFGWGWWRTRAYDVAKAATKVGSSVIAICSHRHQIGDMIDAGIHVHVEKPVRRTKVIAALIDSFFQTAEDNIARMKTAILSGDLQALRAAAHMVCGSSQQLGARRFGMTCRKLEDLETTEGADALIVELEGNLEGAREALTGLADRALDAAS